jgi:multidrug efflux pump subunit AcrA (membrane-fusion protein)
VQTGQTVAELAPAGAPLVIEAMVANTDVGRVKAGQRVRIKVDAYPYQRYGTLEGEVTSIAPDTTADKSGASAGSAYRAIITPLPSPAAKSIPLRLGLSTTTEIITARPRIIELIVRTLRGES